MRIAIVALSLIATTGVATAKDYWVSDELTITLRRGESTQHQIIKTIVSGTKLNITQTNEESGYSYAILDDGTEGWVLTRFLVDHPVTHQQLESARKDIAQLRKENRSLKNDIKALKSDSGGLEKEKGKLEKQNTTLANELKQIKSISANSLAIAEENQDLNRQIIQLETRIQSLEQENLILKDRSDRDWFIAGTGVTLLGMFIGLIAPRIRMRKKAKWSEL